MKLLAISVDSPDVSRDFAARLAEDGKGEIRFPILSDPEHRTIDEYGLRDPAYAGGKFEGIPHPAVYVINQDGKVNWVKVETDYKKRPSNRDIRLALDELGSSTQP